MSEWDCDGQHCHCHEPFLCPDCGCLYNEGAGLDVERLARALHQIEGGDDHFVSLTEDWVYCSGALEGHLDDASDLAATYAEAAAAAPRGDLCDDCGHLDHGIDWCDETVVTGSSTQEQCGCSPADYPE